MTENTSISSVGPQILLFSLAGAGTAAGISLTRWILTETGEVMLLFSNGGDRHDYCDAASEVNGNNIIFPEESTIEILADNIASTCTPPSTPNTIELIGKTLLQVSSSPHLRSVPLFFILLSSTTFFIGLILTQKQLSRISRSISNYRQNINAMVISIVRTMVGEEIGDELEVQQQLQPLSLTSLRELFSKFVTVQKQQMSNFILIKMDNMVMDDYARWFVQNGAEWLFGLGGGIALYSLPESLFATSVDDDANGKKKSAIVRQRLIHAADPWLERVLFQRGGVWDVLPSGWRQCLTSDDETKRGNEMVVSIVGQRHEKDEKMIDDGFDATQETLVGTEVSAASIGSTDNETDDEELAFTPTRHVPPMSSVEMKRGTGGSNVAAANDIQMKESLGNALYATVCDVVASNLTNALLSKEEAAPKPRHEDKERDCMGQQQTPETGTSPHHSPSPQEQIEVILHRTTVTAATIFLCQFLTSPTTRRSWMSAIKFLASAGLFSTAISAGVASHMLRASDKSGTFRLLFNDTTMTFLRSKLFDGIHKKTFPLFSSLLSTSVDFEMINSKIRQIFDKYRKEIMRNKRLQATFALTVLYGMKQLKGRRSLHTSMKGRRMR